MYLFTTVSILLLHAYALFEYTQAAKDQFIYCGACICMTEEMGWQLSAVNDKKTVDVGDYRLDSHGKMKTNKVKYKQSDVYLFDVLEKICNAMTDYHVTVDSKTKTRAFIRTSSRLPGERISLTNIVKSNDTTKMLKFACENLIEEFEDEIIEIYKTGVHSKINEKLCVDISGYCTPDDIHSHMMATAQAVLLGYQEATGVAMDGFEGMFDLDPPASQDEHIDKSPTDTEQQKQEL